MNSRLSLGHHWAFVLLPQTTGIPQSALQRTHKHWRYENQPGVTVTLRIPPDKVVYRSELICMVTEYLFPHWWGQYSVAASTGVSIIRSFLLDVGTISNDRPDSKDVSGTQQLRCTWNKWETGQEVISAIEGNLPKPNHITKRDFVAELVDWTEGTEGTFIWHQHGDCLDGLHFHTDRRGSCSSLWLDTASHSTVYIFIHFQFHIPLFLRSINTEVVVCSEQWFENKTSFV